MSRTSYLDVQIPAFGRFQHYFCGAQRADTAFYQSCADIERLIRHYLVRSRWVNDRVRLAAAHEASVVLEVGPGETVDALMTRCVQRLWPG